MKKTFIAFVALIFTIGIFQTVALAQAQRAALYRYTAPKSKNDVYAASDAHRTYYKQKNYKEINSVGYVYLTKQPGTTALYHFTKKDGAGGNEHFYTASIEEAAAKDAEGTWILEQFNKGIVGYVPVAHGADAKNVYRFLQQDGKTNIYAFSKTEVSGLTGQGLANKGNAFYIFSAAAVAAPAPDVQIGKIVKVSDKSVTFMARSIGGDVSERAITVEITAYNSNGAQAWRQTRKIKDALPQGKQVETTVEIGENKTLQGVKFKLRLDGDDQLVEPLENNNESKLTDGTALNVIGIPPVIIATPFPIGGEDLTLRHALYYNRRETAKVLTASTYAAPDKSLTLKKNQAISCDEQGCEYNLGFFAQRGGDGKSELSSDVYLTGNTLERISSTVSFAAGERSKDLVFKVKLKPGENRVKVQIDANKKALESNEDNNSFEVTIFVEQ